MLGKNGVLSFLVSGSSGLQGEKNKDTNEDDDDDLKTNKRHHVRKWDQISSSTGNIIRIDMFLIGVRFWDDRRRRCSALAAFHMNGRQ